MSESAGSLRFRPMRIDDLELVLAWRSNPEVYGHFLEQDGPLEWSEHVRWFATRPPTRHDFVIEYRGRRVGVVSLDSEDEVGVYVGEIGSRGEGIGTRAVEWLCEEFADEREIRATVDEANEASARLFERVGFVPEDREDGWISFRFETES